MLLMKSRMDSSYLTLKTQIGPELAITGLGYTEFPLLSFFPLPSNLREPTSLLGNEKIKNQIIRFVYSCFGLNANNYVNGEISLDKYTYGIKSIPELIEKYNPEGEYSKKLISKLNSGTIKLENTKSVNEKISRLRELEKTLNLFDGKNIQINSIKHKIRDCGHSEYCSCCDSYFVKLTEKEVLPLVEYGLMPESEIKNSLSENKNTRDKVIQLIKKNKNSSEFVRDEANSLNEFFIISNELTNLFN